jgi:hypothetical protein
MILKGGVSGELLDHHHNGLKAFAKGLKGGSVSLLSFCLLLGEDTANKVPS